MARRFGAGGGNRAGAEFNLDHSSASFQSQARSWKQVPDLERNR